MSTLQSITQVAHESVFSSIYKYCVFDIIEVFSCKQRKPPHLNSEIPIRLPLVGTAELKNFNSENLFNLNISLLKE